MVQHGKAIPDNPLIQALQWHLDQGIDVAISDEPVSFFKTQPEPLRTDISEASHAESAAPMAAAPLPPAPQAPKEGAINQAEIDTLTTQAKEKALSCNTLEELSKAISEFNGLTIKRTATNMVFADGNPAAKIMLIGEAPGADEDRQGKPFMGPSGQLLDKIISFAGLSRGSEDAYKSLYISNILNWRPPGNRTPEPHEMALSLPFIERHIALINPDIIILTGNVATKTLLKTTKGIMRIRGKWQDYTPLTDNITQGTAAEGRGSIPVLPTLHPTYLLRNPADKAKIWQDILTLESRRQDG